MTGSALTESAFTGASEEHGVSVAGQSVIDVAVAGTRFRVRQDDDARYGEFWASFGNGGFEPATIAALADHVGPETTFVDVGAWIGPFTLLAAALGAHVVAYEPDPVAFGRLAANLALNAPLSALVECHQLAVSADGRPVVLDSGGLGLGNGRSRLRRSGRRRSRHRRQRHDDDERSVALVDTVSASELAAAATASRCIILKIDIEGGEYEIVPRLAPYLREQRPIVLLSLHGPDPMEILATRFGRVRLVAVRLRDAPRRARVVWALRHYDTIRRVNDNRTAAWTTLSRRARLALVVRAGETELLALPAANR